MEPSSNIPSPSNDPYGFIMDTNHQPKKSLLPKGNGLKSKLLLIVGLGISIILALILLSSLLNGNKNNAVKLLSGLVAEQTEIVRVATLGLENSTDPSIRAYTQTTLSSVKSDKVKLTSYLTTKKIKLKPDTITSMLNEDTDKKLESAKASNTYDKELVATLKLSLQQYLESTQASYKVAKNEDSRKILSDSFDSTKLLLE